MIRVLVIILLIVPLRVRAFHKPAFGFGHTDNANKEDTNKDADFYWFVQNYSQFEGSKRSYNLWLSYKNFNNETLNNNFYGRAGTSIPFQNDSFQASTYEIGIGAQIYPDDEPAYTEQAFNYYFADISMQLEFELGKSSYGVFEPGYEFKTFTDLSDRYDNRFFGNLSYSFLFSPRFEFKPELEVGYNFSSEDDFTKLYIDVRVDGTFQLARNSYLDASYHYLSSNYPNREISSNTTVSRGRGTFGSKNAGETLTETITFTSLIVAYRENLKNFNLRGRLEKNDQTSRSGFEDYSELVLSFDINKKF